MRLTSHNTYWSVVVEGVSCAKNIKARYKRGANNQITIAEENFHITALLIKGFHPTEGSEESKYWWGAWVPQYMDWKYWEWPGLRVAPACGLPADPRRAGWSPETTTR
eukprot:4108406-Alexandrium_andersonii.AAC.1